MISILTPFVATMHTTFDVTFPPSFLTSVRIELISNKLCKRNVGRDYLAFVLCIDWLLFMYGFFKSSIIIGQPHLNDVVGVHWLIEMETNAQIVDLYL